MGSSGRLNISDNIFYRLVGSALVIVIVTIICFYSVLDNDFTNWDDHKYILENPLIKNFSLKNTKTIFSTYMVGDYDPLAVLSFSIDYTFSGLNPSSYHLTNVILHMVNSLLVLFLAFILSGKILVSLVCSLLFSIHPLHAEPVAWTVGRGWLLSTFFYLLTIIFYLHYKKKGSISFYVLALAWFALSLFSKSMGITLPLVLFVFDYWEQRKLDRKGLLEKIPFLTFSVVFSLIVIGIRKTGGTDLYSMHWPMIAITSLGNILTSMTSIVFYLSKTLVPVQLSALYTTPKSIYLLSPAFLAKIFMVVALTVVVFYSRKYTKIIFFSTLFFLISILPFLQIITFGVAAVADRYMYVPSIGLFFLAGTAFETIYFNGVPPGVARKVLLSLAFCLVIVLFGFLTHQRCDVWQNSITLWEDVKQSNPDNPIVLINMGNALTQQGRFDEAISEYRKILVHDTNNAEALLNLGVAYSKKGNLESAISVFTKIVSMDPRNAKALNLIGAQYAMEKRFEEATAAFQKAVSQDPDFAEAYYNWGVTLKEMRKYDEAERMFRKAAELGSQQEHW